MREQTQRLAQDFSKKRADISATRRQLELERQMLEERLKRYDRNLIAQFIACIILYLGWLRINRNRSQT